MKINKEDVLPIRWVLHNSKESIPCGKLIKCLLSVGIFKWVNVIEGVATLLVGESTTASFAGIGPHRDRNLMYECINCELRIRLFALFTLLVKMIYHFQQAHQI